MEPKTATYFDQSAATWDDNPTRIALMKAVGNAILREVRPTATMDALDYGCGTGMVSLFLLPHVRSVTGADNSDGMLDVLRKKIAGSRVDNMKAIRLDLESDPASGERYHLIVACMVLHHTANTARVLGGLHTMLHPRGILCIADLDSEPGVFHDAQAAATVHHHGFDRAELKSQLARIGFPDIHDTTAHTIRKPIAGGTERDFPVFLMTARA